MKRFILTLGGLLAFCLFTPDYLTSRADAQNSASENKPNVIVIYTDDQGYGDVSALNPNAKFQTPNLDRLAKEGIAFTHGHSPDSVCTPSRYGLLTGRYCWRTKRKRGVLGAEAKCLIPDERITLANLFKDNGYNTAMVGKWHLGMDFPGTRKNREHLTDDSFPFLESLVNLEELDLTHAQVSPAILERLKSLPKLQTTVVESELIP